MADGFNSVAQDTDTAVAPSFRACAGSGGDTFGKLVLKELRHADFEGMPGDSEKGVGIFIPATGMRSLTKPTGVVTLYRRHKESDIPETLESSDRRKMKKN